MDYATLIGSKAQSGSIKNWINAEVPAADILTDAQEYIYGSLRVRQMLGTATGTFGTASRSFPLPVNFLLPRYLGITGTAASQLQALPIEDIDAAVIYDSAGTVGTERPSHWAIGGDEGWFRARPDAAHPYLLRFFEVPAHLGTTTVSGTTTGTVTANFLTLRMPRLVRATCMAFAAEFMKDDERKLYWLKVADKEIATANWVHRPDTAGRIRDTEID